MEKTGSKDELLEGTTNMELTETENKSGSGTLTPTGTGITTTAPTDTTSSSPAVIKVDDPVDMSFGFNNEAFSDHKLAVVVDGDADYSAIIHVSKLLIAGKSVYFREKMTPGPVTVVTLPSRQNIQPFIDLIRWMYIERFHTIGIDLLDVMTLAFKFKVKAATACCATELVDHHMTVEHACKFMENEIAMRREYSGMDESEFGGFVQLWEQAKRFLQEKFCIFTMEAWTSKEFLDMNVEGIVTIFSSNELKVGTENTIFAAYRQWIHCDFMHRKRHAVLLLPLIRFPFMHHNYLLDVVRTEADLDYPEEAKKIFAKQIIDAYVYHCCSSERVEALKEFNIPKRIYSPEFLATKFFWKITNISSKKEAISDPFFLGGYFLYLLMQRKNMVTGKGGGTVGLYMHLKVKESGLNKNFYIPLVFELLIKNKITSKYICCKGIYQSPFTYQNRAWGYVDILGMTWDDFISPSCPFSDNDCLYIKASVAFN